MIIPIFAAFQVVFQILLTLVAIFLILLVLVQRGRGGGLAGALGGMGGSSAFGAKAGDIFTRITIVAAAVWILLCIAATKFASSSSSGSRLDIGTPVESSGPLIPGADASEESTSVSEDPAASSESSTSEASSDSADESKAE
ncbi:preprotein translocase subunit SecG [Bythopirellula goksoeyrii]|uniref:Protein-export membrane protein SecG n=1 Tax=Bythopirellula goksoeyrii TaxID=1400387 RepID=A0A5B9QKZ1_9BACT|nr:preprotein translocase subunit SecG [Bythopirellula goksoeyrii]QEG34801.1 preprotein translocase subunit SecG [Bythopirellula goksoeyrii]